MYKNLLLVIDLNNPKSAKTVVDTALQLSANHSDVIYRVATVIEPVDDSFISAFLPRNFDKSLVQEVNAALHSFTQQHFPKEIKVQHIVAHGTIYEEVIRISQETDVDLILMLATSTGKANTFSNNTRRIVKYGTKPVLILK